MEETLRIVYEQFVEVREIVEERDRELEEISDGSYSGNLFAAEPMRSAPKM